MARGPEYTPLELRVLGKIKKHLLYEFDKRNIIFAGGIHIKPKPPKKRLDVIEINTSGIGGTRITQATTGLVNINYQNDDYARVEEVTIFVNDLLTDSLVEKFYFEKGYQDWDYQIYRTSPYLWLGNNSFMLIRI